MDDEELRTPTGARVGLSAHRFPAPSSMSSHSAELCRPDRRRPSDLRSGGKTSGSLLERLTLCGEGDAMLSTRIAHVRVPAW